LRGCVILADICYCRQICVNHGLDENIHGWVQVTGNERFCRLAMSRVDLFHRMNARMLCLHLKKAEFRLNHRECCLKHPKL
jgi:hypothetical protein